MDNLKDNITKNLKSSSRFGDLFVTKNWQELLKERRFLFFTKRGPIEIVFNIKHYLSGFFLSLLIAFKFLQFLFFGTLQIISTVMIHNNAMQEKQFTESEVKALKELAETVKETNQEVFDVEIEKKINKSEKNLSTKKIGQSNNKLEDILAPSEESIAEKGQITINDRIKSKISDFTELVQEFKLSMNLKYNDYTDESIFDDFSGLANPHMVPIEETTNSYANNKKFRENIDSKKKDLENKLSYNFLPVIPFAAPRNNKTKMIQFSKTIDLEILELVNVFKTLKLQPDNIDLNELDNFSKNNLLLTKDSDLIDELSSRFNYLDRLKEAIIFLPLKPPMQYYYVSSQYGMRIHPKTKKKQMHKGIDMAGTWQEEVRASANGVVIFSGRFGSFGKVIKIKHKHGVETLYGHLHKLLVKKGNQVVEGQIIGKMGATGRVAGAHLHYEIKVNKKAVNPYNFISLGRNLVSSSIIK
mgnify:CR=1 FL=1